MFPITPYPAMTDPNLRVAEHAIPEDKVKLIREIGEKWLEKSGRPAEVGFHEHSAELPDVRTGDTVWLPFPHEDPEVLPLYLTLGHIAQEANAHFWQYDVWGFEDNLHYVRYRAEHGGHFKWHQDRGDDWRRMQRKLAVIVLLSGPDEYEGGEFQIFDGHEVTVQTKGMGDAIVIPSFVQHRVLPVTKGERRVLIGWLGGPRFR